MKRALSMLIVLTMLLSMIPAAQAASGVCGDALTWKIEDTTLTISGKGDMYDYSSQSLPWEDDLDAITDVVIQSGVTSIGDRAFSGCSNLIRATIPEGVTEIGGSAFSGTKSLKTVKLPSTLTKMGNSVFYRSGIQSIEIPTGIKVLPNYTFWNCSNLESVKLPEGLTEIGEDVFVSCESLSQLNIPSSLAKIGTRAFYNCRKLEINCVPYGQTVIGRETFYHNRMEEMTLPSTVTTIGQFAFHTCQWLQKIVIPDSVTSIDEDAFNECPLLVIYCNSGSYAHSYALENGIRCAVDGAEPPELELSGQVSDFVSWELDLDTQTLTFTGTADISDRVIEGGDWRTYGFAAHHVVIHDGITAIGNMVFQGCDVYDVRIPDSVTRIGVSAFSGNENLRVLNLPDGIAAIGAGAFSGCSSLEWIHLPKNLKTIEANLFYQCYDLTTLEIPDGVESIGDQVFAGCGKLTSVAIPESVTCFGDNIFRAIAENVTIYGVVGSLAETYANENKIAFRDISEYEPVEKPYVSPFVDVVEGRFYYQAVRWAVENGITKGVSDTQFAPEQSCTRGQVVTFLWNAAGKPEPESKNTSFADVEKGRFYYKAVLWAAEQGIVKGLSDTEFGPNGLCTRDQVVTFLYRYAGQPEVTQTKHPFTDVRGGRFYYNAMLWAVENGITSGMTATTFAPDGICTRAQFVTFLYRYETAE